MLGFAHQRGLVPVSAEAIAKAIELNGAAVKMNQAAFLWGRRVAVDATAVERMIAPKALTDTGRRLSQSLDELIERRVAFLTAYQNAAYAERYRSLVQRVRQAEAAKIKGAADLAEAVARYAFKLMAYKDEYEVARLYAQSGFLECIAAQFEGNYQLHFHLAPPLFAKRDRLTGELRKREYGPWIFTAFKLLPSLRGLRGSALDIFGYTKERRTERQLMIDYEHLINEIIERLSPANHALAVELASIPEEIRGYGHVKMRNLAAAQAKQKTLLEQFHAPQERRVAA